MNKLVIKILPVLVIAAGASLYFNHAGEPGEAEIAQKNLVRVKTGDVKKLMVNPATAAAPSAPAQAVPVSAANEIAITPVAVEFTHSDPQPVLHSQFANVEVAPVAAAPAELPPIAAPEPPPQLPPVAAVPVLTATRHQASALSSSPASQYLMHIRLGRLLLHVQLNQRLSTDEIEKMASRIRVSKLEWSRTEECKSRSCLTTSTLKSIETESLLPVLSLQGSCSVADRNLHLSMLNPRSDDCVIGDVTSVQNLGTQRRSIASVPPRAYVTRRLDSETSK